MDPHQVLGLSPTASLKEAEKAYHRLLRACHPDLHQGGSPEELELAERRTRLLNAAIEQIRARHGAGRHAAWVGVRGRNRQKATTGRAQEAAAAGGATWGSWSGPADQPSWSRREPSDTWTFTPPPPATDPLRDPPPDVRCPTCGEQVFSSAEFKFHIAVHQQVRLGGRRRRRRRAGRPRTRLSLWVVGPCNAFFALGLAGVVSATIHDPTLTLWASAVAMAPSAIRAFSD